MSAAGKGISSAQAPGETRSVEPTPSAPVETTRIESALSAPAAKGHNNAVTLAANGVASTDTIAAKGIATTDTLSALHLDVVKRCTCGRAYELEDWRQLKRHGLQMLPDQDACLDLRACAGCGSCIALPMLLIPAPEVSP